MEGDSALVAAIGSIKDRRGAELLILGHHYQRSEIVALSDMVGDSYELSRRAAQAQAARYVVFCGVHFMAESADLLAPPGRTVQLPVLAAGCPMAEMATRSQAEEAWDRLAAVAGPSGVVPLVYMNSTAEVKAFCGRHGGAVCTSGNARRLLGWALEGDRRVLFLPDEHLGRNTARELGVPDEDVVLWNPAAPDGGLTEGALRRARVVLWRGFCFVHQAFTSDDVAAARERHPGARVLVHPECRASVCTAADGVGSTAWIVREVEAAPIGSTLVIGTEVHLVDRLAAATAGKTVVPLARSECRTMAMTTLADLLTCLQGLGTHNVVRVADPLRVDARRALERMLELCA